MTSTAPHPQQRITRSAAAQLRATTAPEIRPATAADMTHLKRIEDAADALFIARFAPDTWETADDADVRMAHGGWVLAAVKLGEPVGFVHVLDPSSYFTAASLSSPQPPATSRRDEPSTSSNTAHIEALAVHPASARQGIGRALVNAALQSAQERGYARMSLRTYADVPWNGPFYASCGFCEVPDAGWEGAVGEEARRFYAICVEREEKMGLMQYGRRVLMTRDLGSS